MARADRLTIRQKKRTVYSDFRTDFGKNAFTGYLGKLTNEDAVKQAFRNLMLTNHGERFFDADYGANLTSYLFENLQPDQMEMIRMDVQSAVSVYDGRITIHEILIPDYESSIKDIYQNGRSTQLDSNVLSVKIVFSVVNIPDVQSVDIDIKRVR
jgi:phage baseplate assembly protein W